MDYHVLFPLSLCKCCIHCGFNQPQVFNVAGYYGADQAVCSLYALGRLGGTVIDIGHGKIGAQLLIGMCRWRCVCAVAAYRKLHGGSVGVHDPARNILMAGMPSYA